LVHARETDNRRRGCRSAQAEAKAEQNNPKAARPQSALRLLGAMTEPKGRRQPTRMQAVAPARLGGAGIDNRAEAAATAEGEGLR
jgi:hypothetical protein